MQTATRSITYNTHSRHNPPQITVKPGEVFLAETELCSGDWLNSFEDTWSPGIEPVCNPSVCIGVEGAKRGNLLAVEILEIVPDGLGNTGIFGGLDHLPGKIRPMDFGEDIRNVRIDSQGIHWSDTLKLPLRPMIGTLGTAPAEEALSNGKGGPHGGNMDVQEVCAGSTVYLPVEADGALLHIGDAHALQGDGEVGSIECRSVVKLRVALMERPDNLRCVRIEDERYIMTVACERTVEESFCTATGQLIQWMVDGYGCTPQDAYLLLGLVMEARATQFINPTSSYICKMPKRYL